MEIFAQATRKKLAFATKKGTLSVQDLWDLNFEQLDEIYRALKATQTAMSTDSLLTQPSADNVVNLKIDLVKYVFDVKRAESDAKTRELEKAQQKQKIMDALAAKRDQALTQATEEQLMDMLKQLS